jgi:5-methylcytosine-specific restriction enzyme subunit McrC
MISDGDNLVTFLDAKYRDLWERDLPREMLYQLAMYALSHGSVGRAAIVYPSHTSIAREAVVEISDMGGRTSRAQVALRPFDLSTVARIVEDRDRSAGESLAWALVYGACWSQFWEIRLQSGFGIGRTRGSA